MLERCLPVRVSNKCSIFGPCLRVLTTQAYSLDLEYWLLPEVTGMYYGSYELTEASIRQVRLCVRVLCVVCCVVCCASHSAHLALTVATLQIVDTVSAAIAKQGETSAQCAGGVCQ